MEKHSHKTSTSVSENAMPVLPFSADWLISDIILRGDMPGLLEWVTSTPMDKLTVPIFCEKKLNYHYNTIILAEIISITAIRCGIKRESSLGAMVEFLKSVEEVRDASEYKELLVSLCSRYVDELYRKKAGSHGGDAVERAVSYIARNIHSPLRVSDIANAVFLSRSRLSQYFREQTGMTITDYIRKEKIQEAQRMLSMSTRPISQISMLLGFSSQSHFTRIFKQQTGVTPKIFREQHAGTSSSTLDV